MSGMVSVIMPCYNDGAYLDESIGSVLKQTYAEIELIIIDDGSDDPQTIDVLRKQKDPRIRLLRSRRLLPAGARNLGIKAATGSYLLPLDADDLILPTYIEKAVAIIDSHPDIGIVYCKAELFGAAIGPWKLPKYSLSRMLMENLIFVSALFRKEDWHLVGGFEEHQFRHGLEDYDFWLSLLEIGRDVYQIPEVLFRYRVKSTSRTTQYEGHPHRKKVIYDTLYQRHQALFERHAFTHMRDLRHELLRQQRINGRLRSALWLLEKAASMPIVRTIVRKCITK